MTLSMRMLVCHRGFIAFPVDKYLSKVTSKTLRKEAKVKNCQHFIGFLYFSPGGVMQKSISCGVAD